VRHAASSSVLAVSDFVSAEIATDPNGKSPVDTSLRLSSGVFVRIWIHTYRPSHPSTHRPWKLDTSRSMGREAGTFRDWNVRLKQKHLMGH